MTDVAVLVPWSTTDPGRIAAWDYLSARWSLQAFSVVTGAPADGPWCKAAAVADALERTDAEVLVIADADVWCDGTEDAVRAVRSGIAWAVPHRFVHRLAPDASRLVIAGTARFSDLGDERLVERPYRGHAGGGIVVIRRDVYKDCPLDQRFVGWGQEDDSWALALNCLHGAPWRGAAPLWHLWHEPEARVNRRIGSLEGKALHRRYVEAKSNPDRMRELVAGGRVEVSV